MDFGNPTPNYRYKGFYKFNYQSRDVGKKEESTSQNNRRVVKFLSRGVEKHAEPMGLKYGSGKEYPHGRRLDQRMSGEIVKHQRQQIEAEEDIRAYRERKIQEERKRTDEKKKDLEMLQDYRPWGRQIGGGGAPRISRLGDVDTRRAKLDFQTDSSSNDDIQKEYYPFGRPGGGAPMRSDSGNLVSTYSTDPDTRFQKQLRKEVECSLRYKATDDSVLTTPPRVSRTHSEIERREIERENKLKYAQRLEKQQNESRERRHVVEDDKQVNEVYNPWGSGHPSRDDSGKVKKRNRTIGSSGVVEETDGRDGWWLTALWSRSRERKNITKQENKNGYDPWGKPGGGAPLASTSGQVVTNVYGNFEGRKDKDSESELSEDTSNNRDGLTVAAWLRKGKVGQRHRIPNEENSLISQTKNTSDVTSQYLDIRREVDPSITKNYYSKLQEQADLRYKQQKEERLQRIKEEQTHTNRIEQLWPQSNHLLKRQQNEFKKKTYHEELQEMVEKKEEEKRKLRDKDIEREKEHVESFNNIWGRPGCGAPRKKGTIDEIDTSPRSYGTLMKFMTHTGEHKFRRS